MANSVILYDFWASWCGPCKIMNPIIEELEKEYAGKIEIKKINVDEDQNQPLMEKYAVNAMPTYIVEKNGQVVNQLIGSQPKKILTDALDKALG